MPLEPAQLVSQGFGGNGFILVVPALPLLPVVAAAPAGQHHDSVAVAQLQEAIVFQLAFEAHGIEVHVLHVFQLGVLALGEECSSMSKV